MARMEHITVQQLKQGRVPRFHWHSLYPNIYPTMPLDFDNTLSYIEQIGLLYAKMNELLRIVAKMLEEFYDYADDLFEAIVNIYNEIVDMYNEINEIYEDIKLIEGNITNIYNDIKDIYQNIQEIYNNILDVLGNRYVTLNPSTDYDTFYYNDWYSDVGYQLVNIIEGPTQINIAFTGSVQTGTRPKNDNLLANTQFRHTSTVAEVPRSAIYSIRFKGEYSSWNDYTLRNITENTGIWNVRPVSARASWEATCVINRSDYDSGKFIVSAVSYADGYNTQFSQYGIDGLYAADINLRVNATLIKP